MKYVTALVLTTAAIACGQQEPDVERVYITRISPSPVPGERGPAGEPGVAGERGETGAPGAAGERGEQGEPGIAGTNGQGGTDGIDGQDGINGTDGAPGPVGPAGPAGTNGITYSFTVQVTNPCTQVTGTTYWIFANTVYTSNLCDNSVKLGTIGMGGEFWLTTTISLIRLNTGTHRKEQVN